MNQAHFRYQEYVGLVRSRETKVENGEGVSVTPRTDVEVVWWSEQEQTPDT